MKLSKKHRDHEHYRNESPRGSSTNVPPGSAPQNLDSRPSLRCSGQSLHTKATDALRGVPGTLAIVVGHAYAAA
jgi:hypothetical protein